MKFVYLAGPIHGCSDEEAHGWRWHAQRLLERYGLTALNPMSRDYRGKESENIEAIISGDLEDIRKSSAVIVRCDRPSWGTAMEVRFAFAERRIPVVGLSASPATSPWILGHTNARVQTVADAVAAVAALLA